MKEKMIQIISAQNGRVTTLCGLTNLGYVYTKDFDCDIWEMLDPPAYPPIVGDDNIDVPNIMRYSALREKSTRDYLNQRTNLNDWAVQEEEVYDDYVKWTDRQEKTVRAGKKIFRKTAIKMGWEADGHHMRPPAKHTPEEDAIL